MLTSYDHSVSDLFVPFVFLMTVCVAFLTYTSIFVSSLLGLIYKKVMPPLYLNGFLGKATNFLSLVAYSYVCSFYVFGKLYIYCLFV